MPSPFPGMDPYIESSGLWGDFHLNMISAIQRRLAALAPDRYLVRAEERSYLVLLQQEGTARRSFLPDVSVTTTAIRKKPGKKKGGTALAEAVPDIEPVTMRAVIEEEHREAFIEIRTATPEQRLVTCVEVLSPTNKQPGTPGWDLYQHKRQSSMLGGVHLVEIDLLRGGQRMPMLDPWPESPYRLLVARAHQADQCRVWPAFFQRSLPAIPVPLLKPDADVALDLQPILDAIYASSRYERSIDYRQPPAPALAPDEAAWLKRQLQSRQTSA